MVKGQSLTYPRDLTLTLNPADLPSIKQIISLRKNSKLEFNKIFLKKNIREKKNKKIFRKMSESNTDEEITNTDDELLVSLGR